MPAFADLFALTISDGVNLRQETRKDSKLHILCLFIVGRVAVTRAATPLNQAVYDPIIHRRRLLFLFRNGIWLDLTITLR